MFLGGLAKCVRRRTPLRETTVSRSQVPPYLHPGSPLNQRTRICTSTTRSTSAVRWFLEEENGEAESAKSEMMVASSVLL